MVALIVVNLNMRINTAMESTSWQMETNTKENGLMENSTEMESSPIKMVKSRKAFGKTESVSTQK